MDQWRPFGLGLCVLLDYVTIWVFPKLGVGKPPKSSIFKNREFSIIFTIHFGGFSPLFLVQHPYVTVTKLYLEPGLWYFVWLFLTNVCNFDQWWLPEKPALESADGPTFTPCATCAKGFSRKSWEPRMWRKCPQHPETSRRLLGQFNGLRMTSRSAFFKAMEGNQHGINNPNTPLISGCFWFP